MALSRIDSSHFLCAYAGNGDDGWAVVLSTDPQVAHWKLDETSGTSAADAAGNGHTATLTNMSGSEWTTGTVDGALEFDGINDYVEMTSNSALQLTSALTIAGWIKCDIWGSGADVDIILRKGTSSTVNYQLAIVDGKVALMLDAWESSGAIKGDTTLSTGQWYHVAATWDGANVRIYLDGVLDNSPPDARSGTIGTVKVEERKTEDGEEQVQARHILTRPEASRGTLRSASDKMDDFLFELDSAEFAGAAEAMGLEIETTPPFARGDFIPGIGLLRPAHRFAFTAAIGANTSSPVEDEQYLYAFRLKETRDAGLAPFEIVKERVSTAARWRPIKPVDPVTRTFFI